MSTVTVEIRYSIKDAAYVAANPTKVLSDGEPIYLDDGTYAFGDGVTALSGLTFFGGSSGLDVGTTSVANATNGYILYNNNGTLGEKNFTGTGDVVLATSPTFVNNITVSGASAGNLSSTFKNTNSAGYAVVHTESDDGSALAELVVFNSAGNVGGLYNNNTPVLSLFKAGHGLIINESATGSIKVVVGGYTSTEEKLDITTTTTTFKGNNVVVQNGKTLTSRTVPRITTIVSSATPTINTDNCDAVDITALATAITSFTTNLSGTPNNFDKLIIRIKDDGTARALAWGASFEAKGVSLPTTTVISKVLTVGFIYDSVTSKWGCVASAQEA